jgi:hypothetical protein
MNVWKIVGWLMIGALAALGVWWDVAEEAALRNAADLVDRHDDRVRHTDDRAGEDR